MDPCWLSLSARAGSILVAGLWQGAVLATATAVLLRCVPRVSAGARFGLWTATLALVTMLPLLESLRPAPGMAGLMVRHTPVLQANARWGLVIGLIWLCCALLRAVNLLRGALRLRRTRKCAVPVEVGGPVRQLLLSRSTVVEVRQSGSTERPGVTGFFSPCILLPFGLAERLSTDELAQVVLHEMEHLRRRDDWFNLLQKVCLVLLPLNPALLWIDRRLCFERELACDEAVVRRLRAPRSYALLLTKLAEQTLEQRAVSLMLGAMERPSQLARRVYRILEERGSPSRLERFLIGSGLTMVLAAGSVGLARCPELVGFGGSSNAGAMTAHSLAAATPHVIYREAELGTPTLVHASLLSTTARVARKRHVTRVRHAAKVRPVQQLHLAVADRVEEPLDTSVEQPLPLLVGYRLVRIDGGWLLLQL